jgi:hypothetical protein
MILGDNLVAGAVIANGWAKRDMDVKRQRAADAHIPPPP